MNLPDAILIRPLTVPVNATISAPGSKSLTNRALILAALSEGSTQLQGALWSEDTEWMVNALRNLGFQIEIDPDRSEQPNACNRFITVFGRGGLIPAREADLYVGTAGTVARFLTAFCALGSGRYRIHGTPRMHERPMKGVFDAIRSLGVEVEETSGRLPATIHGPIRSGRVFVSGEDSSQFASAMLLISQAAGIEVDGPSSPYIEMTRVLLEEWKISSPTRAIEPDASSASYFTVLQRLHPGGVLHMEQRPPRRSSQVDFCIEEHRFWPPPERVSREKDLGDAVLTLVMAAAAMKRPFHLIDAAHLRDQECDRIAALATELGKCGVPTRALPDELILEPAKNFKRAVIQTYQDHRIAMSFAILASIDAMGDGNPWLTLENPSCVIKTFPNFFETMESTVRQSYAAAGKPHLPMVLTSDGQPVFG